MDIKDFGKLLMFIGGILLVLGSLLWIGGKNWRWIGNLPGDIHIKKPGFTFFMPITTMIILSILLSLIVWLIKKWL